MRARLDNLYRAVPHLHGVVSGVWTPDARTSVVVVAPDSIDLAATDVIVWGEPFTPAGPASDTDVAAALTDPQRARALSGVFALCGPNGSSVRLVSSSAFVATIRRCRDAFATRALAALAMADVSPRIDPAAAIDAVALGHTLGGGELFHDVSICDDACVIDVTAAGIAVSQYLPLADSMQRGSPLTAKRLAELAQSHIVPFSASPRSVLALTGGRDSVLAAGALAASDGSAATFTMGWRGTSDVDSARRLAHNFRWQHSVARSADAVGRPTKTKGPLPTTAPGGRLPWLSRLVPWTEGLHHPRDAFSGWLRWPNHGVTMITGHGGEIGRAFYYHHRHGSPRDVLIEQGPGGHLRGRAKEIFAARANDLLSVADSLGRPDATLDLFYALGRMRRWVGRGLPQPQIDNLAPLYLEPTMVAALLDTPEEKRRTGEVFDEALRALSVDRFLGSPPERRWTIRRRGFPDDWPLLDALIGDLDGGTLLVPEVLGGSWWEWVRSNARHQDWVRQIAWACVALEVANRWCLNHENWQEGQALK